MTNSTNLLANESLGNIKGLGPLGDPNAFPEGTGGLLEKLLSNIIGFLTVGAILWFIVQIVIGGYSLMTAGGDPKGAADARQRIINAVIGLVVVFIALVFVSVIGFLLGIDILKIGNFINNLSI
ncbi:MAG: hypothetical protein HY376_04060 [Candidatus Blackburnbacteria bacterium]|nr:hypothetical protein [Candidatus Blackburnbacteria bacterium]